jgi:hypothetical protein
MLTTSWGSENAVAREEERRMMARVDRLKLNCILKIVEGRRYIYAVEGWAGAEDAV